MSVQNARWPVVCCLAAGVAVACGAEPVERVPPVADTGTGDVDRFRFHGPDGDPAPGPWTDPAAVAWVDGGALLAVTIRGSSSCPRVPGSVEVTEPQHVTITVAELRPEQDVCSADDAPYVSVIEVPSGLDPARPATALVDWGDAWAENTTVRLPALD